MISGALGSGEPDQRLGAAQRIMDLLRRPGAPVALGQRNEGRAADQLGAAVERERACCLQVTAQAA